MKYTQLILLFLFGLMFQNCEQEGIISSFDVHPLKKTEILPLPSDVRLDQLEISFVDGIPRYESTNAFLQAKQTLFSTHNKEYFAWAETIGFTSTYAKFEDILNRYEKANKPEDFFLSDAEKEIVVYQEGHPPHLHSNLIFAKLTNDNGRLIIGGDLHIFTKGEHILIDDVNLNHLRNLKKPLTNNPEKGIYLFPYEEKEENIFLVKEEYTKTRSLLEDCIYFAGDSEGGSEVNYERTKLDEQRVGCNRRGCRQRLESRISVWTIITEALGTEYRAIGTAVQSYSNTRRSGWKWIRTFPNNRFDAPPGSSPLRFRLTSDLRVKGNRIVTLDEMFFASYPSTQEEISAHDGSANGSHLILDVNLGVPYPASTVTNTSTGIYLVDGRTRCRWSNRGNDPVNDPIAVVFGCN